MEEAEAEGGDMIIAWVPRGGKEGGPAVHPNSLPPPPPSNLGAITLPAVGNGT